MRKISSDTFISIATPGRGNIFPVAGAFVLVISMAMPLFNLHYTLTTRTVFTLEALLERFSGGATIPVSACIAIIFNFLLGLYVLLGKNTAKAPLPAIIGIILSIYAATRLPVPPGSYGAGVYTAFAGLGLIASGLFSKPS
jgi:hypothetical protein